MYRVPGTQYGHTFGFLVPLAVAALFSLVESQKCDLRTVHACGCVYICARCVSVFAPVLCLLIFSRSGSRGNRLTQVKDLAPVFSARVVPGLCCASRPWAYSRSVRVVYFFTLLHSGTWEGERPGFVFVCQGRLVQRHLSDNSLGSCFSLVAVVFLCFSSSSKMWRVAHSTVGCAESPHFRYRHSVRRKSLGAKNSDRRGNYVDKRFRNQSLRDSYFTLTTFVAEESNRMIEFWTSVQGVPRYLV